MSANALLEVNDIAKRYSTASGDYLALQNVSFDVSPGEMLAVVGKSGSGKSTLLNMLTGIDHPSSGNVTINGTAVHTLNESTLATWRGANIGIVFQFFQLIPTLTILENLLLAMEFVDVIPKEKRTQRATDLLEMVGIKMHANKLPASLSGGEQQRAAIARALANDPPILVADEPTGNLDSNTTADIQKLFKRLAENGKTIIVVTHDDVSGFGFNRVLTLSDGYLITDERA